MSEPTNNPPFDDKPCPGCPWQVRSLFASAHNLVGAMTHNDPPSRIAHKLDELRMAVEAMQPLIDAHFADKAHSHGPRIVAKYQHPRDNRLHEDLLP